jgi:hypothetical protein
MINSQDLSNAFPMTQEDEGTMTLEELLTITVTSFWGRAHCTTLTEGLIKQQPRYHVGPFDLAFVFEMTTPQL